MIFEKKSNYFNPSSTHWVVTTHGSNSTLYIFSMNFLVIIYYIIDNFKNTAVQKLTMYGNHLVCTRRVNIEKISYDGR